jgi:peptide-methionine (S)-S-oxide reductase
MLFRDRRSGQHRPASRPPVVGPPFPADGPDGYERATFAAGCFWGVEAAFGEIDGVTSTAAGYTGGHASSPTYEQVCSHRTGHAEAVEVWFDPAALSYTKLLDRFWSIHNPTTRNRQGPDIGDQYRSAIYFHTPGQEAQARASLEQRQAGMRREIVTEITSASAFHRAEEYHQRYFERGGRAACAMSVR